MGLVNAGATYQQRKNKIFTNQLRKNMEVYVDDMIVKSEMKENHITDFEKTFDTIRRFLFKLNPSKCSFGVSSGMFLGHMICGKGIEVNHEKIRALLEMLPPFQCQTSSIP